MTKKLIITLMLLVFAALTASADQASDIFFHRGIQKYLKKDYVGAIQDAEKAATMDPTDKKATAFLVKACIEKGRQLYNNKQFADALEYFEKARKFDPSNKDVGDIIGAINEKLKPIIQTVVTVERSVGSDAATMELIKSATAHQDKLIEAISKPNELIRQILNKSDAERRDLMNALDKKNDSIVAAVKSEKDSIKSLLVYGIIGFVVSLIFIVTIIYVVAVRTAHRREMMIMKQQEALLGVMLQQQVALAQGGAQLRLGEGVPAGTQPGYITPRLMLNDSNPRVRAKGIEIIDAQMISENEDPDVAEKVLEGFLEDKNNRVRANAAKSLFKYNKEKAYENIERMLRSDDKWMRISAVWVLGELEGDEKAVDYLLSGMEEQDYHFKKRLVKSLQKLAASDKLPEGAQKKIKDAMEKISITDPKVI